MTTPLTRMVSVHPLDGMRLAVRYQDGQSVTVDCSALPQQFAVFVPLRDTDFFRRVAVADWGHSLEWPNGEGLDADRVLAMAREQQAQAGTPTREASQEQHDLLVQGVA